MNIDYVKTKVDFYKNYTEDYENFFVKEVEPSNQVISSSNSSGELQRKVRNVRKTLQDIQQSLQSNWEDDIETQFSGYIASCDTYLEKVESSIGSDLKSAEDCYKQLAELLKSLKTQNTAYQSRFDEMPHETDVTYKETVKAYTDEKGIFHQSYTRQDTDAYLADYNQWETDVRRLGGECINTIAQIEVLITNLSNINRNVLAAPDASSGVSTTAPVFELDESLLRNSLELSGTASEYIDSNGLKYTKISKWGQEFYVLADVKGGSKQSTDHCLAYADAYAQQIISRTNSDASGAKHTYTSMDKQAVMQIAANELLAGHPVNFEVQGTNVGDDGYVTLDTIVDGKLTQETVPRCHRHFVTVYGIKADADLNNLQQSDFIYLDPAGGQVKQLATNNGGSQRRDLVNSQAVTYQNWGSSEYYCVTVYDDTTNYDEVLENVENKGSRGQNGGGGAKVSI